MKIFASVLTGILVMASFFYSCINKPHAVTAEVNTLIHSKKLTLTATVIDSASYQFTYRVGGERFNSQAIALLPSGLPGVVWSAKGWVYLKASCGTSCTVGYLIPLNGKDSTKIYMFPVFVDKEKHLIGYCSEDNELVVENFASGKAVKFSDENLIGPYCGYSVDSVVIEGGVVSFSIPVNNKPVRKKVDISSVME